MCSCLRVHLCVCVVVRLLVILLLVRLCVRMVVCDFVCSCVRVRGWVRIRFRDWGASWLAWPVMFPVVCVCGCMRVVWAGR